MCGRFTLKTPPAEWSQLLIPIAESQAFVSDFKPRFNIAPTQNILAILEDGNESSGLKFGLLRWGLVPSWSDDLAIGNRMINARSETLLEKRSFKGPLTKRRCLIVADGYYEWEKRPAGKQACWMSPAGGGVIQFAGLWENNAKATEKPVQTCTIITTSANSELSHIHDRMPATLTGEQAERWMADDCDAVEAQSLLCPTQNGFFDVREVSNYVNNPRHEGAECLE